MGGLFKGSGLMSTILDPASFFGEPGSFSFSSAIDPGGTIIQKATGSDFARRLADPGEFLAKGKEVPPSKIAKDKRKAERDKFLGETKDWMKNRRTKNTIMNTADKLGGT